MSVPPKATYRFNVIPIKNAHGIFHRARTNSPKVYIEPQKTLKNQSNLDKEEPEGHAT